MMIWLLVDLQPPLKNDGVSSSVMMTFPTEWKVIKFTFQTANQFIDYMGVSENVVYP